MSETQEGNNNYGWSSSDNNKYKLEIVRKEFISSELSQTYKEDPLKILVRKVTAGAL